MLTLQTDDPSLLTDKPKEVPLPKSKRSSFHILLISLLIMLPCRLLMLHFSLLPGLPLLPRRLAFPRSQSRSLSALFADIVCI